MRLAQDVAPGLGRAWHHRRQVDVRFTEGGDGTTTVSYDATAVVGGMVGGVGQRMLTSVSQAGWPVSSSATSTAVLTGAEVGVAAPVETATTAAGAPVFTAPARASGLDSSDFVKGIAVGAGLVLLGVVAGVGARSSSVSRR